MVFTLSVTEYAQYFARECLDDYNADSSRAAKIPAPPGAIFRVPKATVGPGEKFQLSLIISGVIYFRARVLDSLNILLGL